MHFDKHKKTLFKITLQAGDYALKEFYRFDRRRVRLKSKREIVTAVDLKAEKIIISGLKKHFPETGFISEEAGKERAGQELVWVIDPVDGTTNFSMRNPLWAVSIALARQEQIVLALVYAPALGELFFAELGQGAWRYPVIDGCLGKRERLSVSNTPYGKVLNTFCHGNNLRDLKIALRYYRQQKLNGLDCRQLGSAALESAFVAAGRVESLMIPGANAYDVAAGALLVKEAGGRVTDFSGQAWIVKSRDFLASNPKVHPELLRTVAKAKA